MVSCGEEPDDCIGKVWVFVTREDPGVVRIQEPLSMQSYPNVDLSGEGTGDYLARGLPAGTAWLAGFLDDDGNASALGPLPDKGDPARFPAIEVTLEPGERLVQDLQFNLRSPL